MTLPTWNPSQLARMEVQARRVSLTGMQTFWYVFANIIYLGAAYFAKVPAKRALEDVGLANMTGFEKFWYVLMNIAFGYGYFAKLGVSKALTEVHTWPNNL